MTISSTTVKNSYSGNGSTVTFNYTFKIFASSDLEVIIRDDDTATETVQTLNTHYSITGVGDANGGSITFLVDAAATPPYDYTPAVGETVVLRRNVPQTQAIDYIANDPFPAESHEEGLDRLTMQMQQVQEEIDRSIKLSKTNTMTDTSFAIGATDRASKVLAFDDSGEISVTQELGTYQGDWSADTDYNARDLVKDTSTNNIFLVNADHTSSGSQPLTTNTNSSKYDLIIDAAAATTSATNAASSASAAATSATNAATSASNAATSESNASTSETNASTSETNAQTAETGALAAQTAAETAQSAAETAQTAAETAETNAETSETNAASSASSASTSATNASTSETNAATSATTATTKASEAATSATTATTKASEAATSATNAATSATSAETAKTAAETAQAAAETALDNFDDIYLGAKASDPALDNDGDALTAGDLYFNTTVNQLKYYDGSSWSGIGVNTDETVKVSSNDTTNGYLNGKLVAGTGISLTENSDGGNETLTIKTDNPTITSISPDTITNAATAVTITGTGFVNGASVEFVASDGDIVLPNSISFTNSTTLAVNVTLPTDGTYFIRVENPDGLAVRSSTALLTVSDAPTWTTAAGSLGSVAAGSSVSLSVAGTSDSTVAYSETTAVLTSNTDTPNSTMNLSLNSSTGAITGTAPEPSAETTYNFTLRLTDDESQTTDRAFSITVTTGINNGGQFN